MKIGPIDISITLIAYIGGVIAAAVVLMRMWGANKDVRVESYCRDAVIAAMVDSEPEVVNAGADKCEYLLAQNPDKNNVRLYLGVLQMKQKRTLEAQKTFMEVTTQPNATNQEKAWAFVCAGVAQFNAATNDGANKAKLESAALAAEKLFLQALAVPENKENIDALINLGTIQLFKNQPNSFAEMQKYCERANAVKGVASLKGQEALYGLNGRIAVNQNKYQEATDAFERAKALNPSAKDLIDSRRYSILGSISQDKMDPAKRQELLEKVMREVGTYGANQAVAQNAIGIGWFRLKPAPDYDIIALGGFRGAIAADPKDPRGYKNLAALFEDQINDYAKKLSVDITGIRGETPVLNKWIVRMDTKAARFQPSDMATIDKIRKLVSPDQANSMERLWKEYLTTINPQKPADRVNARLRQLASVRRFAYLLDESNDNQRPSLLQRALELANEVVKDDPNDPAAWFALGQVQIDRKEYLDALKSFKASADKGMNSPELLTLIEQLSRKPELIDRRPDPGRRWYGARPIIGATMVASVGSSGSVVKMKIDDKEVPAEIEGSQVLYFPGDKDLDDGEHTVYLSMKTPFEAKEIVFPPAVFNLDKKPPTVSVSPDVKQPISPKNVWTVVLSDSSGIDTATLTISLTTGMGKGNTKNIIEGGKYKIMQPDLGVKANSFVDPDKPIKFGFGFDIPNGECRLNITVQDQAGNELKDTRTYNVKGGIEGTPKSTIKFQDSDEKDK